MTETGTVIRLDYAAVDSGPISGTIEAEVISEQYDQNKLIGFSIDVQESTECIVVCEADIQFLYTWADAFMAQLEGETVLDGALTATSENSGEIDLGDGGTVYVSIESDEETGDSEIHISAIEAVPGHYALGSLAPVPGPEPVALFSPCPYGLTHYGNSPLATEEQLAAKQDVLTAGEGITIVDDIISATGGGTGSAIVVRDLIELPTLSAEIGTGVVGIGYNSFTPPGQDVSITGQAMFTASGVPVTLPLKYEEKGSANASGTVASTVLAPADLVIDEETGLPAAPYTTADILMSTFAAINARTGYADRKTVNTQLVLPAYDVNFMTSLPGASTYVVSGAVPIAQARGQMALTLKKSVQVSGTVSGAASSQSVEAYLQYTGFGVFLKQGDSLTLQVEKAQGMVGFDSTTWPFDAGTAVTIEPSVGTWQITNLVFQGYGTMPFVD